MVIIIIANLIKMLIYNLFGSVYYYSYLSFSSLSRPSIMQYTLQGNLKVQDYAHNLLVGIILCAYITLFACVVKDDHECMVAIYPKDDVFQGPPAI